MMHSTNNKIKNRIRRGLFQMSWCRAVYTNKTEERIEGGRQQKRIRNGTYAERTAGESQCSFFYNQSMLKKKLKALFTTF